MSLVEFFYNLEVFFVFIICSFFGWVDFGVVWCFVVGFRGSFSSGWVVFI